MAPSLFVLGSPKAIMRSLCKKNEAETGFERNGRDKRNASRVEVIVRVTMV